MSDSSEIATAKPVHSTEHKHGGLGQLLSIAILPLQNGTVEAVEFDRQKAGFQDKIPRGTLGLIERMTAFGRIDGANSDRVAALLQLLGDLLGRLRR